MTDRRLAPVEDLDEPPEDPYAPPAEPHDRDAEAAVLGSCLLDKAAIADVWDTLQPDDFHDPKHELIYDAITTAYARLEPCDVITITDRLAKSGQINRCGGPAYLHHLAGSVIITTNAGYYAAIVADRAARRRLLTAACVARAAVLTYGDTSIEELREQAAERLADVVRVVPGTEAKAHPWQPQNLADVLNGTAEEITPTILTRTDGHAMFYPGAVHTVSGEPESGKTWVALIACAQQLKSGASCTYVDFEDRASRVIPRLMLLGAPCAAILERFHYIRPLTAIDPTGARHLDQAARDSALVVIDGVTEAMSLHGLDLNAQNDVATFLHMLPRRLADLGPAVVQIDHVVKNADQQGRFAIGAQHKLAGIDGAAYMVKVVEPFARGKAGRARITVAKDRPGSVREHASGNTVAELVIDSSSAFDGMRHSLDTPHGVSTSEATGQMRPTFLMERASRVIEADAGLSGKSIELEMGKGKTDFKRLALRTLVAEGYVATESGPHAAVFYHSVTPFREATDE